MGLFLLILFSIIEIAFIVFTIVKKSERQTYVLQRLCVNAGQMAIYLLSILLPGIDFSFRFMGFFLLLALRVLIAGIAFFISYKKAEGKKKYAGVIIGAIFSILFAGISLVPSFLFSDYQGLPTTGTHEVAMAKAILIDEDRTENFETDGSKREIPMYFYYPADADGTEKYPLVIFSHGAFGYYQSNTSTYMELVSHGYVVVSLDHPYHSFFTTDTEGKTITVNPEFMNSVMAANGDDVSDEEIRVNFNEWLKIRTDDVNCVLDSIIAAASEETLSDAWFLCDADESTILSILSLMDCDKIGLTGQSLGGATAVSVGRERTDIDAVIDLDGTMNSELLGYDNDNTFEFEGESYPTPMMNEEPYPIPILSFENDEHYEMAQDLKDYYVNYHTTHNALNGSEAQIVGSGHMNFTDLPLFAPALAKYLGTGSIDPTHGIVTMNEVVLGYFDQYLKDGEEFQLQEQYE